MTISEAQRILHCPDAYGGIHGKKYGQALAVAFESLEAWKKVKAEIEDKFGGCSICEWFEDYDYEENNISEYQSVGCIADILKIIDKYKVESEDKK